MKNIFKFLGIALMAGAMMVACDKNEGTEGNDTTPTPTPTPDPVAAWAATFDNTSLDVAGYAEGIYLNDVDENQEPYTLWVFQAAKSEESGRVAFPYIVSYLTGEAAADVDIADLELYKDTYYTAGNNQYGDWQLYNVEALNCTALDMTKHMMSFNTTCTMYSLTDIVEEVAEDAEGCTKATLSLTASNIVYTAYQQ